MPETRSYKFSWDLLGDIKLGRPNLGDLTRIENYRLMQFTFRDVIERRYGIQVADQVFYEAGELAGKEFYQHTLKGAASFDELIQ